MTKLSGRINERYYIIRTIGRGGLTTVYKAFDIQEKRQVAIKVLAPHLVLDPTFKARFNREIKILGQFDHPNIVPILDAGEYQGAPFLVMPFFSEGTLADRLRSHPLSPVECGRLINDISSALSYEHKQGIFHRDIKPSNILLNKKGKAYLSDFDLVYLSDTSQNLTGSAVIGTPAYMSPEQCSGGPIDARSDQYSLAVVLYQLTTGHLPFNAETPIAIAVQQINEILPKPRELNPELPEAIEAVLVKALSKDPGQRYPTIRAFNHAFQRALKVAMVTTENKGSWTARYYEITQGFNRIHTTAKAWFTTAIVKRRIALLAVFFLLLNVPFILFAVFRTDLGSTEEQLRATIAAIYTEYAPKEGTQQQSMVIETIVAGTVSALEKEIEVMAAGMPRIPFTGGESDPGDSELAALETSVSADVGMSSLTTTPSPTSTSGSSSTTTRTPTVIATKSPNPNPTRTSTPKPMGTQTPSQAMTPVPTSIPNKICDDRGKPLYYEDMHQHPAYIRGNGFGMTIHAIRVGGEETDVILKKVIIKQGQGNPQVFDVSYFEWTHWGIASERILVGLDGNEVTINTDLDFYDCYAAGKCDHSLYGGDIYVNLDGELDGIYQLILEIYLPEYRETCTLDTSITVTP